MRTQVTFDCVDPQEERKRAEVDRLTRLGARLHATHHDRGR
jgi:hypothetical protein